VISSSSLLICILYLARSSRSHTSKGYRTNNHNLSMWFETSWDWKWMLHSETLTHTHSRLSFFVRLILCFLDGISEENSRIQLIFSIRWFTLTYSAWVRTVTDPSKTTSIQSQRRPHEEIYSEKENLSSFQLK
jgi:hypothetical protein